MGKVLLLTGIPGVGKTTLATAAVRRWAPVEVVSFAQLLLEALQRAGKERDHESLRRDQDRTSSEIVAEVRSALVRKVVELRTHTNVLIDAHAVTKKAHWIQVTPASAGDLSSLGLDGIIVTHGDHAEISNRTATGQGGRVPVGLGEVAVLERFQDAVAVYYAAQSACSVYAVDVSGDEETSLKRLSAVFDAVGMSVKPVG